MTTTTPGAAEIELAIGGMACASCAARIEKKLNRMDGVEATGYSAREPEPEVAMAMAPALQFDYGQWLSLTLAAPVVTYAAWPFHKAAWTNARHGAATMDTLISVGTTAAFLWSLWALFFGTAGTPGMAHPFEFTIARSDGAGNICLEAAAGVTTFILAGRYFEARSKRKAGAALKALRELGAQRGHRPARRTRRAHTGRRAQDR